MSQNRGGKLFIKKNNILCQWCKKEPAECNAHIMSKKMQKQMISAENCLGKSKIIAKGDRDHKDTQVSIGITCEKCDGHIAKKYEDKDKDPEITLWKVAAFYNFVLNYDKDNKFSCKTLHDYEDSNEIIEPNQKEIDYVMRSIENYLKAKSAQGIRKLNFAKECKKNNLIEPKPYYLPVGWGFKVVYGADKLYNYIYFDTNECRYYIDTGKNKQVNKKTVFEAMFKDRTSDVLSLGGRRILNASI